jgi:hypothetical protein
VIFKFFVWSPRLDGALVHKKARDIHISHKGYCYEIMLIQELVLGGWDNLGSQVHQKLWNLVLGLYL